MRPRVNRRQVPLGKETAPAGKGAPHRSQEVVPGLTGHAETSSQDVIKRIITQLADEPNEDGQARRVNLPLVRATNAHELAILLLTRCKTPTAIAHALESSTSPAVLRKAIHALVDAIAAGEAHVDILLRTLGICAFAPAAAKALCDDDIAAPHVLAAVASAPVAQAVQAEARFAAVDLLATLAESTHGRAAVARVRTIPRIVASALEQAAHTPNDCPAAELASAALRVAAASLLCNDGRKAAKSRGKPVLDSATLLRRVIEENSASLPPGITALLPSVQAIRSLETGLRSLISSLK